MKIKKGDLVKVISGKDKGKQGQVLKVLTADNKVIVKGVNIVTKHKKNTGDKKVPAGRIKIEAPLFVSKVMFVNDKGKTVRLSKIRINK